ncbi:Hypothetical predicted protein, partial [Paramuricea clavata]
DVSTPTAIANLFNRYFTSVLNTDHGNLEERSSPPLFPPSTSGQSDLQLTIEEVARTLLALDTTKATGPDGIPFRLLKETAWQIAPSLTQIFNEIPDEWKLANIVASCTTQLLEILDYIGSLLDGDKQTDVIYMDMSEAFDKVHHKYLISKLSNVYGISGKLLRLFESYLINRKQRVTVLGATSSARPVLSGVPQGSILGPILFLLYASDLPDAVEHTKIASFADDTKLFKKVDSTSNFGEVVNIFWPCLQPRQMQMSACNKEKESYQIRI